MTDLGIRLRDLAKCYFLSLVLMIVSSSMLSCLSVDRLPKLGISDRVWVILPYSVPFSSALALLLVLLSMWMESLDFEGGRVEWCK